VTASTLTIIAVFLPMTMIGGFAGVMFNQLGWMVTIIISLSLIIAMTLTPMMSAHMLRGNKEMKVNGFDRWYNKRVLPLLNGLDYNYSRLVNKVVRRRRFTVFIIVLIFVVSVVISAITLKTEFLPQADNNNNFADSGDAHRHSHGSGTRDGTPHCADDGNEISGD